MPVYIRIGKLQNTNNKSWLRYGPKGTLTYCWWKCKWYVMADNLVVSHKIKQILAKQYNNSLVFK